MFAAAIGAIKPLVPKTFFTFSNTGRAPAKPGRCLVGRWRDGRHRLLPIWALAFQIHQADKWPRTTQGSKPEHQAIRSTEQPSETTVRLSTRLCLIGHGSSNGESGTSASRVLVPGNATSLCLAGFQPTNEPAQDAAASQRGVLGHLGGWRNSGSDCSS